MMVSRLNGIFWVAVLASTEVSSASAQVTTKGVFLEESSPPVFAADASGHPTFSFNITGVIHNTNPLVVTDAAAVSAITSEEFSSNTSSAAWRYNVTLDGPARLLNVTLDDSTVSWDISKTFSLRNLTADGCTARWDRSPLAASGYSVVTDCMDGTGETIHVSDTEFSPDGPTDGCTLTVTPIFNSVSWAPGELFLASFPNCSHNPASPFFPMLRDVNPGTGRLKSFPDPALTGASNYTSTDYIISTYVGVAGMVVLTVIGGIVLTAIFILERRKYNRRLEAIAFGVVANPAYRNIECNQGSVETRHDFAANQQPSNDGTQGLNSQANEYECPVVFATHVESDLGTVAAQSESTTTSQLDNDEEDLLGEQSSESDQQIYSQVNDYECPVFVEGAVARSQDSGEYDSGEPRVDVDQLEESQASDYECPVGIVTQIEKNNTTGTTHSESTTTSEKDSDEDDSSDERVVVNQQLATENTTAEDSLHEDPLNIFIGTLNFPVSSSQTLDDKAKYFNLDPVVSRKRVEKTPNTLKW